jgi:hypothetical protein
MSPSDAFLLVLVDILVEEEDVNGSKCSRSGVAWVERAVESGDGDDAPEVSIPS